jgi:hypothetical protein
MLCFRIIEEEDEKQNVNFQTNWIELRDLVKKVYRDSEAELSSKPLDVEIGLY